VDAEELQARIAAFPRWNYRFELPDGVRTPVASEAQANRQAQRRRYFFDALLGVCGGTLAGRRVLDLGCNAGYFSLLAAQAGADFVLGVDAREDLIEQAELVFEATQVARERYRFDVVNVFERSPADGFDIVLCLGMFDVSARPLELFALMRATGAELIVIDTAVSRIASAYFEVSALSEPANAIDHQITLLPSREAIVELAREFGYQTVALAHAMGDYAGVEDYRRGQRLAFVCSRQTALAGLDAAPAQTRWPWWADALHPRALLGRLSGGSGA
jgi:SAM-dependent methyltransferase